MHPQGVGEPDSPFEVDVAAEVRRLGYDVTPQVGCSGYRIDLGVHDPAAPGDFLLAVECDGATYHSAPTARDRDRLRQEVLEQLGWRVYRIWSRDWIYRRSDEIERLRRALEEAVATRAAAPKPAPAAPPAPAPAVTKVEVAPATAGPVTGAVPYRVGALRVAKPFDKEEPHTPAARPELCRLLVELAEAEGPVHIETAVRRLRQAWKAHRAGGRMRKAIEEAATACAGKGQLRRQGDFLYPAAEREVAVRVPDPKNRDTEREIEHIAPEEVRAAMRLLLRQGGGLSDEALLAQTARLFGFAKLGDNLRRRLQESLDELQKQDLLSPHH
jgi:very-short-patch-repair endonuclease